MVSEIKHFADWNNTQGLYEAIKALNGLRKQTIFPCPTDKKPLHKDEYETKQLADHFETLFNHIIFILNKLPDYHPIRHLDTPPLFCETQLAI